MVKTLNKYRYVEVRPAKNEEKVETLTGIRYAKVGDYVVKTDNGIILLDSVTFNELFNNPESSLKLSYYL